MYGQPLTAMLRRLKGGFRRPKMPEAPPEESETSERPQNEASPRTDRAAGGAPPRNRRGAVGIGWLILRNYSLVAAFVFAIVFFSVARPDIFPTPQNARSILTGSASLLLIAFGVMVPLIVQQFDLTPSY